MPVPEYARMSFWYPRLEDYTIPSVMVEVGEEGARLLSAIEHRGYDLVPLDVARRLLDRLPALYGMLEDAIWSWRGVFIKDDLASPKDSCHNLSRLPAPLRLGVSIVPGTMGNACIAHTPEAAIALYISSERVLALGDPRRMWLREPWLPRNEHRVFVTNGKPRLISWYYPRECPRDPLVALHRLEEIEQLAATVAERLGIDKFTMDVAIAGKIYIVEVNPFPGEAPVDRILFERDFEEKLRRAEAEDRVMIRSVDCERRTREEMIERSG